jgi:hypothetical protein
MSEEISDPTGLRYYGSDMTIHGNSDLDVEVDENGRVVSVWFRCQPLPFKEVVVSGPRASEMRRMYQQKPPPIEALVLKDEP